MSINAQLTRLSEKIEQQEQQIKELKKFVVHDMSCKYPFAFDGTLCTCGLNKLLNKH